jgi:hypothetical protein
MYRAQGQCPWPYTHSDRDWAFWIAKDHIRSLAFAASAVRAESDRYSIRPLDLNRAADRDMLIRTLDPNGTATRMS